jgi:hypothetical protein
MTRLDFRATQRARPRQEEFLSTGLMPTTGDPGEYLGIHLLRRRLGPFQIIFKRNSDRLSIADGC